MTLTDLFLIDGQPVVPPEGDMELRFEDVDSPDSGRDAAGFMHRIVMRHGVGVWSFRYSRLRQEEYRYMESLFAGKEEFSFTHPGPGGPVTERAYRSNHSITWHSARTQDYRNYRFNIIVC